MELSASDARVGASPAEPRQVATRYLGGAIGLSDGRLIIDELELVQSVALQSDLWTRRSANGRSRPPHAGGARGRSRRVAGWLDGRLHDSDGGSARARHDADRPGAASASPQPIVSETDVEFAAAALVTRWPDHCRGAAHSGGPAEIVLVDVASKQVRTLASLPGGRNGSPAWMPDGAHVLFAAAVGAEPFRIYRVDVAQRVGFASRRHRPERAVSRCLRRRRARRLRRQHRRRLRPLLAAARRRAMDRWSKGQGLSRRVRLPADEPVTAGASGEALLSPGARSRRRSGRRPSNPTPTNWSSAPRPDRRMRSAGTRTASRADGPCARGPTGRSRMPTTAGVRRSSPPTPTTPTDGGRARFAHARSRRGCCCRGGACAACDRCSRRSTSATISTSVRRARSRSMLPCVARPGEAALHFSNAHAVRLLNQRRRRRPIDGDRGGVARARSRNAAG